MCENEQKPELEPEPCYEKKELWTWSWSHVHEKKGSGAGAVSFLRRLRSPG